MQKTELITFTTDLGDQFAAARLKIRAIKLGYRGEIVENHNVTPFSIVEGAFILNRMARDCLPGSATHVAIVDPDVGSKRRGIILRTERSFLIGPDNGVLVPTATEEGIKEAWKIDEGKINGRISVTFHGRDVFTPAAVYLAQGRKPESFGCTRIDPSSLVKFAFEPGQVAHVDHYGNLKILGHEAPAKGSRLSFRSNSQCVVAPFRRTFSDVPPGTPVAIWGSDDTLELAVNQGRADMLFSNEPDRVIKPGHLLEIQQT